MVNVPLRINRKENTIIRIPFSSGLSDAGIIFGINLKDNIIHGLKNISLNHKKLYKIKQTQKIIIVIIKIGQEKEPLCLVFCVLVFFFFEFHFFVYLFFFCLLENFFHFFFFF